MRRWVFQSAIEEVEGKLQLWERKCPGAKVLAGMDANCQFTP